MKKSLILAVLVPAMLLAAGAAFAADTPPSGESKDAKSVTFDVEGMHCGGCAGRGERALKAAKGVVSAKVSFEDKSAVVSYRPAETNPDALIKVLKDAGLTAKVRPPKKDG
jgi:copper chaperone CopZ